MAFCTFCGKKLDEGEVCACRQTVQPAPTPVVPGPEPAPAVEPAVAPASEPAKAVAEGDGFAAIVELVKNMIKKPITAAEEFYQKTPWIASIIILGILTGTYMLRCIFNMLVTLIYTSVSHASIAYESIFTPGQVIGTIFYPLLYMIVMSGAVVGLAFLFCGAFLKQKMDFKKLLSFCGSVCVPLVIAELVLIISNCIHLSFFNKTFNLIILMAGMLTLLQGLNLLLKEVPDRKNFVLIALITPATLTVVSWMLCIFMSRCTFFSTLAF